MAKSSGDLLSRYKSIRRPSLSGGTSSSGFETLARRQAAEEDAIIDNQYGNGDLSPQAYKAQLQKRLARSFTTPAQKINLQEKISQVDQVVLDAEIDRGYAAGEYSTDQVYNYEKNKLSLMTEVNSPAYIKQQQKVQSLKDKGERESRTAFRIAESKRISTMPEDTSERQYAKAQQYQKLADQARIDGDNQQADVFETQMNNYAQGAKRAGINDLITETRLSVSGTADAGGGVPSAEGGAAYLSRLYGGNGEAGNTPSGGGGKTTSSAATTSFSAFQSPAVSNALKSLDRSGKTLDRLYQQRADKEATIQAYQNAVDQATGDQKTQLTIALNNQRQDLANLDNQIGITSQGIEDTVVRIQEAQAKVAASAFNQEAKRKLSEFNKTEKDLETAFTKGQITKQEYIENGIGLSAEKYSFLSSASDGFAQFGNESSADSYLEKASGMESVYENLVSISQNLDDYEPIRVEKGSKLTNLFGNPLKPGEIVLTNVRQLKDQQLFDSNYVKVGNSYARVHYPGEVSDIDGFPVSSGFAEELGKARDEAYIYTVDKDGKIVKENVNQVQFLDENNQPIKKFITQTEAAQRLGAQNLIQDKDGKLRQKTQQDFLKEVKNKQILPNFINDPLYKLKEKVIQNVPKAVTGAASAAKKTVADYLASNKLESNAKDIAKVAENFVTTALKRGQDASKGIENFLAYGKQKLGVKLPPIIPPVYAAEEPAQTEDSEPNIIQQIGQKAQEQARNISQSGQNFVQQAAQNVQKITQQLPKVSIPQLPKITVPKVTLPKVSIPQPVKNIVQTVKNVAAPVVQKVTQAAKSVGSFLKKLF